MATQETIADQVRQRLKAFDPTDPNYATRFVQRLLADACDANASDIHLQPQSGGVEIRWRLDGVLSFVGTFPSGDAADIVTRLKVLAELLTYRADVPQEGRIRNDDTSIEMRVSTFPTLFGERAVVRIFAADGRLFELDQLGLPSAAVEKLDALLRETSGALLITGPAGSGKTTTAYACLRYLVEISSGGRSIVSLEDPIEVAVAGVAQAQVNPTAGFELRSGLKSLLRQDPEVIFVGEIRDHATAEVAFQAALTGQLLVSTFHAGSAAEAVSRLSDMGIESYLLRSGLLGIMSQRLVRRLCDCASECDTSEQMLGLPVQRARHAEGCSACRGTGYTGRAVLAEMLTTKRHSIGQAILSREEAGQIERLAISEGMVPLRQRAVEAVEAGITSPAEVRRVFGLQNEAFTMHVEEGEQL